MLAGLGGVRAADAAEEDVNMFLCEMNAAELEAEIRDMERDVERAKAERFPHPNRVRWAEENLAYARSLTPR